MKHVYKATLVSGHWLSSPVAYLVPGPETAAKLLAEVAVYEGKASHKYPVLVSVEWEAAEHVGIQAGKKLFSCTIEMILHAYAEEVTE